MPKEHIETGSYVEILKQLTDGTVNVDVTQVVCCRLKLGWLTVMRESKLEFWPPTLRCRDRNAVAYAVVCGPEDVINQAINDIISCLGAGLTAAGIASIISSPAAATPAFEAAFKACLIAKIGAAVDSLSVNLEATTETTDWGPC